MTAARDLLAHLTRFEMTDQSDAQISALFRKVLLLVLELHLRGYQRLRIAPGMSASGVYWRCSIAPVSLISAGHGARMTRFDDRAAALYTSGQGDAYFGWDDASHATASGLARRFLERFPMIADAGRGRDWMYSGWYVEMLHRTYPNAFPYAYADWETPNTHIPTIAIGIDRRVEVPLPPPGEALAEGG